MIKRITISNPAATCVPWWSKVPWLKDKTSIEFTPGVNIILGPNGSGKSTILMAIARRLMCAQGGTQKVTRDGLEESGIGRLDGLSIEHDGSPIMFCDPNQAVGLIGGAFDDDFFTTGVTNAMFRGSAGEVTMQRGNAAMRCLTGRESFPSIEWRTCQSDAYPQRKAVLDVLGEPPENPRPTILFDEPTRSLAMIYDLGFWQHVGMQAALNGIQVIVSAHSVFCLAVPGANYIETVLGYKEQCQKALQQAADVAAAAAGFAAAEAALAKGA